MAQITAIAWPVAHAMGASGWHWADLTSALLTFVAVVGLTLLVRGRRAWTRLGRGRDARVTPARKDAGPVYAAERVSRSARPAASSSPGTGT